MKSKVLVFFPLLSVLMFSACGQELLPTATPAPVMSGTFQQTIQQDGQNRTYLLYIPANITTARKVSLLLVFHGGGGQGAGMQALTGFNKIADKESFIVAYPDGFDRNWNDGRLTRLSDRTSADADDVAFISALIDKLAANYPLDTRRVYATGMSNGAIFSQRLGCELSGKIAAIAPVTGSLSERLKPECKPSRPLPVMMVMGDKDPLVPYNGGNVGNLPGSKVLSAQDTIKFWASKNGCTANPSDSTLPDQDPADGTLVKREEYKSCRDNASVVLYTVQGGGHTWPGGLQYLPETTIGKTSRDFNASEEIWKFFNKANLK